MYYFVLLRYADMLEKMAVLGQLVKIAHRYLTSDVKQLRLLNDIDKIIELNRTAVQEKLSKHILVPTK